MHKMCKEESEWWAAGMAQDERWVEAIARKMRTEKLVGENLGKASCSLQTTLDSTSGQCYSIMMS